MRFDFTKPTPPSNDKRWKLVGAAMRRSGGGSSALIETLHAVQDSFGFLETEALQYVAASLKVPYSRVFGVATFYQHFQLSPAGEHRCVLCTGTACHIKGAGQILDALQARYEVEPGGTSPDGKLSLLSARCLGACGLAPVAVFDDEVKGKLDVQSTIDRIERWNPS